MNDFLLGTAVVLLLGFLLLPWIYVVVRLARKAWLDGELEFFDRHRDYFLREESVNGISKRKTESEEGI